MKKIICILLVLTLAFAFSITTFADYDSSFDSSFYRVNDFTDSCLTHDEIVELDDLCIRCVTKFHIDISFFIVSSTEEELSTDDEFYQYIQDFFLANNFGHGKKMNTILILIDKDTKKSFNKLFVDVNNRFSPQEINAICSNIESDLNKNLSFAKAIYNALYSFNSYAETVINYYSKDTLPSWYPEDLFNFKRFNDYNAPRIVDNANIFTSEQKALMQKKIDKIISDYGYDIVVFTDTSTHGLSRSTYAADFHYFNGYGIGDDYTGTILFICLEEGNRGWWTAATGKCYSIYTNSVINYIDDRLEPYMKKGASNYNIDHDYGEGVLNYLDDIYDLYDVPEWYSKVDSDFVEYHNKPSEPRIIDNANVLTEKQKTEITKTINDLNKKYSTDIVVLTETKTVYHSSALKHSSMFYYYNGYGYGDDFDGSILCFVVDEDGVISDFSVKAFGKLYDSSSYSQNIDRLSTRVSNSISYNSSTIFKGINKYLSGIDAWYSKGNVPVNIFIKPIIVISIIIGLIAGLVSISSKKKKMKTVYLKAKATEYLKKDSFVAKDLGDVLVSVSITKVAKSSNSSSGGGGSSHSYHSSSGGGHYSGGGRSF